jgi:hypothetical protein
MTLTSGRQDAFGKHNADYGMRYFYDQYKKANKASTLTQKRFTGIWKDYVDSMMTKVIESKYDFKMQAALGSIYVVSKKIEFKFDENGDLIRKGFRVDWKATNDMWDNDPVTKKNKQVIYHFNEHSSRRNFRWYWDKRLCRVINQAFYMFYPSRVWKRKLAKWIKREDFDTLYYEAQ